MGRTDHSWTNNKTCFQEGDHTSVVRWTSYETSSKPSSIVVEIISARPPHTEQMCSDLSSVLKQAATCVESLGILLPMEI